MRLSLIVYSLGHSDGYAMRLSLIGIYWVILAFSIIIGARLV